MSQLSVIVITFNSAETLERCLESVAFADQIVVVDSGSTDDTLQICAQHGVQVHQDRDWQGFGVQKNRALALARHDLVLSIDADEWVTPELRQEILSIIGQSITEREKIAYEFPRQSFYLGQKVHYCGWWPDYVLRLFVRQHAQFSDDLVHERVVVNGPVGRLRSVLMHDAVRSISQVIEKSNRYSSESAKQMHRSGRQVSFAMVILKALWAFIRVYFLQRGFLDGAVGFMIAAHTAHTTFFRYAKLWHLNRAESIL